ncbi:MAG: hypothetical protein CMF62_01890 [Magnetococcales bacterium]|nr:hypothetical protein [Magnetococcales bacterium]|tara:strand:- start:104983 stop:106524 length:1542 start_codon:yes stop_codon:yes gene_type:complete
MSLLNIKFDKIFVLTLKNDTIRHENIKKIFKKYNINFEFFYGENGNDEPYLSKFNEYYKKPFNHYYEKLYQRKSIRTSGTWGILESYRKLFKYVKKNKLNNFLCFQDDVMFHINFESLINIFFKKINWDSWKMIKLGASQHTWDDVIIIDKFYHPPKDSDGAFAVAYNNTIYDEILQSIELFNCSYDSGALQDIQSKYQSDCYVSYPNLVIADVSESKTGLKRDLYNHSLKMKWELTDFEINNLKVLVSIIIPVYNGVKTISKCIESLLNQTYLNLEIIIVDDCSTDKTEEICIYYQAKYKNVKYFKTEKNSGCYVARNLGIKKSKGQIIGFQDSDDISINDRIETSLEIMIKRNVKIIMCHIYRSDWTDINLNKNIHNKISQDLKKITLQKWKDKIMIGSITTLIDRSLFEKYGLYRTDSRHSCDVEFLERVYCLEFNDDPYTISNMWVWITQTLLYPKLLYASLDIKYISLKMESRNLTNKYDLSKRKQYLYNCKKDIKNQTILTMVDRLV